MVDVGLTLLGGGRTTSSSSSSPLSLELSSSSSAFGAGSGLKGGLVRFLSRLAVLADFSDFLFFFGAPSVLEKQVKEKQEGGAEVCFFFVV